MKIALFEVEKFLLESTAKTKRERSRRKTTIVKKIRRTRIRTETSRLVLFHEPAAGAADAEAGAHEVCPTCGQPVIALEKPLSEICAELHTDAPGSFRSGKKGETE